MWNSTGSSMVRMLIRCWRNSSSIAYRVVDLPQPVGPVARNMPWLRLMTSSMRRRSASAQAQFARALHRLSRVIQQAHHRALAEHCRQHRDAQVDLGAVVQDEAGAAVLRAAGARPGSCAPSTLIRLTTAAMQGAQQAAHRNQFVVDAEQDLGRRASPGRRWMSEARRATASAISPCTSRTTGCSRASRCASASLASMLAECGIQAEPA
jgi:hypothetical protein